MVVGGGHSVPVLTGGDGSLVDQGDFCRPECFEGVESFDDSWRDGLTCNPSLVPLAYMPHCLITRRPMSTMSWSAIVKLVHCLNAKPVKRQRTSVSKPSVGCQSAAIG